MNLWHKEFNIISEMCSFTLSDSQKSCDFERGLLYLTLSYFVHLKTVYSQTAHGKYLRILESTALARAKLLLTEA